MRQSIIGAKIDLSHSLSRGLIILECFTGRQQWYSASKIHELTGIPKATLFRLLNILKGFDYLRYDKERKKYHLGPSVLHMGFAGLHSLEARDILRPVLDRLSKEFNKAVGLLLLDADEMLYIERVRVPTPANPALELHFSLGTRIPVYPSAAGMAVLAHLDQKSFKDVLSQIAKEPRIDIGKDGDALLRRLSKVRQQGYATYNNELNNGVRAIAVPVFSYEGIEHSIQVVVRQEELSVDDLIRLCAPKLIAAGKEASKLLGFPG
jgi:DNA-binding IclR family transcriptional regulator